MQCRRPGLGRSPGEGKGYPLQCSGLENSMDCIVHGLAESDRTEQLSLHFTGCLPFREVVQVVPLSVGGWPTIKCSLFHHR